MGWLTGSLFKASLEWLWGKISSAISRFQKQQQNKKEAEANAQVETEKLQKITPDSSKEDTDAAIDDASKRM